MSSFGEEMVIEGDITAIWQGVPRAASAVPADRDRDHLPREPEASKH